MVLAVERVRDRLLRSTAALEAAGVPYAVVGGNAVAAWVATIDPTAVRNTQDVDILLRRKDFDAAAAALAPAGFLHANVEGVDMFLDGPDSTPRSAVHIVPAGEKIRPEYLALSADVDEVERPDPRYRVVALEPLVRMKLTSFRRKDQVHITDLIEIGLIDASWLPRFAPELRERLQHLIDTPEG